MVTSQISSEKGTGVNGFKTAGQLSNKVNNKRQKPHPRLTLYIKTDSK